MRDKDWAFAWTLAIGAQPIAMDGHFYLSTGLLILSVVMVVLGRLHEGK